MNPRLRFKQADGTDYPDWEEKKLGELFCERVERAKGDEELLSVTIADGVVKQTELSKRNTSSLDKSNYKKVKKGDIAYNSMRMWQGAEGFSYFDGIVSPAYTVITPKSELVGKFFEYLFKTENSLNLFTRFSQGLTSDVWNLRFSALSKLKLSIPLEIEEQEKISDFLSDIDEFISLSVQEVKKLQELKKGAMQKIFSQEIRFKKSDGTNYPDWEEKKLGDICNSFSGGTPRTSIEEYYNGNINFIRSGEIHDSKTELFISEEGLKNSSAKLVNVGDILLALYGATSGEIDLSKINGAINQAILCIRPQEGFNKKFIVESFRYNKNKILKMYLQGGQGNLSAQNMLKLYFHFPCLEEQEKIGDFLSDFDEAISLAKQELEKWKLLKKGLLQQMFV